MGGEYSGFQKYTGRLLDGAKDTEIDQRIKAREGGQLTTQ